MTSCSSHRVCWPREKGTDWNSRRRRSTEDGSIIPSDEQWTRQVKSSHGTFKVSDGLPGIVKDCRVENACVLAFHEPKISDGVTANDVGVGDLSEQDVADAVLLLVGIVYGREDAGYNDSREPKFFDLSSFLDNLLLNDRCFLSAIDVKASVYVADIARENRGKSRWPL